MVDQGRIRKE